MLSIKTILHPTDFSEPSEYAFHLACSLASDYQAQLVIMHVMPFGTPFAVRVRWSEFGAALVRRVV